MKANRIKLIAIRYQLLLVAKSSGFNVKRLIKLWRAGKRKR